MAESTIWWLGAGVAVAVELVSGTFYLLMIAIGLVAAALAAHAGAGTSAQLVVAAIVGGGAVVAWHLRRAARRKAPDAGADPSANLDIGQTVHIDLWNDDGTASVQYRGANWTAVHRPGQPAATGVHRVVEVVGSRLVVDKV